MGLSNRTRSRADDVRSDGGVSWYREQLLAEVDLSELASLDHSQRRARLERVVGKLLTREGPVLSPRERSELIRRIIDEALGLGVLEPLLADETVTEIMVNGPDAVYVERLGKIEHAPGRFASTQPLPPTTDRLGSTVNPRVDESSTPADDPPPPGERRHALLP